MLPISLPGSPYRRFIELGETLAEQLDEMVQKRKAIVSATPDILELMVRSCAETSSDDAPPLDLIGTATFLFIASFETLANAMVWTLLLLAQHPRVMADLHDELTGTLRGEAPSLEQCERLPLLDGIGDQSFHPAAASALLGDLTLAHRPTRQGHAQSAIWHADANPCSGSSIPVDAGQGTDLRRGGASRTGIGRHCDVTDARQLTACLQDMLLHWGDFQLLINNAGVGSYGHTHQMTAEQWDRVPAVNLLAPVQITRELLPTLLAQEEAHILNVCSLAGLVGFPKTTAYNVSKFGLQGLSESLRSEYGRTNLGVTSLCPGFVDTNIFLAANNGLSPLKFRPPKPWAMTTPEKVAKRAIKGIRRNQPLVVVTPFAHVPWFMKRAAPVCLCTYSAASRVRQSLWSIRNRRAAIKQAEPHELPAIPIPPLELNMFSPPWFRVVVVIIVGLALKFGSPVVWLFDLSNPLHTWAFLVPYVLGTAVYLWGCSLFAQAKNRSPLWGCTGFLSVFAMPILYSLKDGSQFVDRDLAIPRAAN